MTITQKHLKEVLRILRDSEAGTAVVVLRDRSDATQGLILIVENDPETAEGVLKLLTPFLEKHP
jgi:hypothetical protein